MPIPQTRVRKLLNSAQALKQIVDEMKSAAERTLSDPDSDGRMLAILISETSIPDEILEVLAIEHEHQRLTWKRNESNRHSLARRRMRNTGANATTLEFDE